MNTPTKGALPLRPNYSQARSTLNSTPVKPNQLFNNRKFSTEQKQTTNYNDYDSEDESSDDNRFADNERDPHGNSAPKHSSSQTSSIVEDDEDLDGLGLRECIDRGRSWDREVCPYQEETSYASNPVANSLRKMNQST